MRLTKGFLLLFFLSFFALNSAQAGILIEPYIGFSLAGTGDFTAGSNQYDESYSTFPTLGGRLGFGTMGFMAGVDYSMQSFDLTSTRNVTEFEDAVSKKQLGVFVGYNLPMMLRFWGTYYLSSSLEGEDPASATTVIDVREEFSDGGGYALGVGFTGFPFISINLEYRTIEYDKYELNGVTVSNYNEKLDLSEVMISVSAPFDF